MTTREQLVEKCKTLARELAMETHHTALKSAQTALCAAIEELAASLPSVPEAEVTRLKLCESRLAAVTVWLDANQPDVFRRGIWDAINAASPEAPAPQPAPDAVVELAQAEPVATVIVEREFHEYEGSEKEDTTGYLVQRIKWLVDLPVGEHALYAVPVAAPAQEPQQPEQTRSQRLKEAGHTRRPSGKTAGGLMPEPEDAQQPAQAAQGDGIPYVGTFVFDGETRVVRGVIGDAPHQLTADDDAALGRALTRSFKRLPEERSDAREVKNKLSIEGHIDEAFRAVMQSREPDATHCLLVNLAHTAVDLAFAAHGDAPSAKLPMLPPAFCDEGFDYYLPSQMREYALAAIAANAAPSAAQGDAPPEDWPEAVQADLRRFLHAAAGAGQMFAGVDASDLYARLFKTEAALSKYGRQG